MYSIIISIFPKLIKRTDKGEGKLIDKLLKYILEVVF